MTGVQTCALPISARRVLFQAGRTAVFVTHRMASTKFADNIVVLERGEVVESGDFAALVGSGGLFEKLFQIQADFYK